MGTETLGTTIRRLREQADLSQEELAAKAQVSRASIQNWEADRRQPRRAETRRLAAALRVSEAALRAVAAGEAGIPTPAPALDELAELRAENAELRAQVGEVQELRNELLALQDEIKRLQRDRNSVAGSG